MKTHKMKKQAIEDVEQATTPERLRAQFDALDGLLGADTEEHVPSWEISESSWIQHVDGSWIYLTYDMDRMEYADTCLTDEQIVQVLKRACPVRACGSRKFSALEVAFLGGRRRNEYGIERGAK